ncbi:MAG: hypothetical protein A2166_06710 [Omnitrophica WOR_2 bacterium RBG_13_41_10]|nr:MAG: hypothetical protein A2166_06710 [Omnitrophica WOR_2 bacterium RBG_13_41_10]
MEGQENIKIQIELDKEKAGGVYSNLAFIHHTETEFILDFLYLQPQQPIAKVQARVITNPRHAKAILNALKENISKYEKKYSQIEASEKIEDKTIGFK